MGAGEVEGLGRGDAGDQTVGNLGRGRQRRGVPGAVQHQIAVDFVGHQNQIAFDAEAGERADFLEALVVYGKQVAEHPDIYNRDGRGDRSAARLAELRPESGDSGETT